MEKIIHLMDHNVTRGLFSRYDDMEQYEMDITN